MKCGRGINDRDDKSSGMEILMTRSEVFAKINPTTHTKERERKYLDRGAGAPGGQRDMGE
jgi:hypothetical protein